MRRAKLWLLKVHQDFDLHLVAGGHILLQKCRYHVNIMDCIISGNTLIYMFTFQQKVIT